MRALTARLAIPFHQIVQVPDHMTAKMKEKDNRILFFLNSFNSFFATKTFNLVKNGYIIMSTRNGLNPLLSVLEYRKLHTFFFIKYSNT